MMMTVAMTFAAANAEEINPYAVATDYSVKFTYNELVSSLNLSELQAESMAEISKDLRYNISCAKYARNSKKAEIMSKSVNENLRSAKTVLNAEQYHQYLRLLNTKMGKQGLTKYLCDNSEVVVK